jgi:hypothetical protein
MFGLPTTTAFSFVHSKHSEYSGRRSVGKHGVRRPVGSLVLPGVGVSNIYQKYTQVLGRTW